MCVAWAKRVEMEVSRGSGCCLSEESSWFGILLLRTAICDGEDKAAAEMGAGSGDEGFIKGVDVEGALRRDSQVWRSS